MSNFQHHDWVHAGRPTLKQGSSSSHRLLLRFRFPSTILLTTNLNGGGSEYISSILVALGRPGTLSSRAIRMSIEAQPYPYLLQAIGLGLNAPHVSRRKADCFSGSDTGKLRGGKTKGSASACFFLAVISSSFVLNIADASSQPPLVTHARSAIPPSYCQAFSTPKASCTNTSGTVPDSQLPQAHSNGLHPVSNELRARQPPRPQQCPTRAQETRRRGQCWPGRLLPHSHHAHRPASHTCAHCTSCAHSWLQGEAPRFVYR
jgi:hypothetical protein